MLVWLGYYEKEEVISDTTENIVNHPGFFKSSSNFLEINKSQAAAG